MSIKDKNKKRMGEIYFKFNVKLLEQISDFKQAAIISFLVNQPKEGKELKIQKWQQTYLADYFKCSRMTLWRYLKDLKENGWLDFEQTKYKNTISTKITLNEKALKYRIDDFNVESCKEQKNNTKEHNHQANISEAILTNKKVVKISPAQQYIKSIKNKL